MKSFKYKHLLLTSLFSMILIYAFTMIYINKNFDFQLAETTFFLSVPKFIEIARLFTYSQVQAYIIQATSIDVIWPISYCLFFYILKDKLIIKNKYKILTSLYILFIFISDMGENFFTARYLIRNNINTAYASVIATNIKWTAIFVLIIIYLINLYKIYINKKKLQDY